MYCASKQQFYKKPKKQYLIELVRLLYYSRRVGCCNSHRLAWACFDDVITKLGPVVMTSSPSLGLL